MAGTSSRSAGILAYRRVAGGATEVLLVRPLLQELQRMLRRD